MSLLEGWRLAVGTLTAIPVSTPCRLDRPTAARAMVMAPVAVMPLGLAVTCLGLLGRPLEVPPLLLGLVAVAVLAWSTRALHWDGLSDVADALTAGFYAEKSLAVMKTGASGPAGTLAVGLVAGLQAVGFAALLSGTAGTVLAGVFVLVSRCSLAVTCAAPFRAARASGLGPSFAGTVPVLAATASWVFAGVAVAVTCLVTDVDPTRPLAACAAAFGVVVLLTRHTVRRFGGVTGDTFGAAIETALATLLLVTA